MNLDLSARQLARALHPRVSTLQLSFSEFRRDIIASRDDRLFSVMRSALHYFGRDGLPEVLRHLRVQMKKGEYFIHQTACFNNRRDADCFNTIYSGMRTGKWYPTIDELLRQLQATGWKTIIISDVPPLHLTSKDLAERYRLKKDEIKTIHEGIVQKYGELKGIFEETDDGFLAYLPYKIFRCIAA